MPSWDHGEPPPTSASNGAGGTCGNVVQSGSDTVTKLASCVELPMKFAANTGLGFAWSP